MEITINQKEIENRIYTIRGLQVMLDSHLSEMYGVQTKVLNQAVKRNIDRFPENFMFQLTVDDLDFLKSQIVTSKINENLKSQFVTSSSELWFAFSRMDSCATEILNQIQKNA